MFFEQAICTLLPRYTSTRVEDVLFIGAYRPLFAARDECELSKIVSDEAVIGLVGKYTELHDTYLSVVKALLHAALHCKRKLTVKWIDSSALDTAKKHKVK